MLLEIITLTLFFFFHLLLVLSYVFASFSLWILVLLQLAVLWFVDVHGRPAFSEQEQKRSGLGGENRNAWGEGLEEEEGGETAQGMENKF